MDKYSIVKKNIDEYDFDNIFGAGAPRDEYDMESHKISKIIDKNNTIGEISQVIADVFRLSWGVLSKVDVNNPDDFLEVAEHIKVEMEDL